MTGAAPLTASSAGHLNNMPFNSLKFLLFLPIVYFFFQIAAERLRWSVLLAASLLFYAALNVPYLLAVLALVTTMTYGFGIWIDQAKSPKAKSTLLWSGIAVNVLVLVTMRYLPFLSENLTALSTVLSLNLKIQPVKVFVAIGVSFYVFQAISYLIDIYLEIEKPESHFGYFALYMGFFPKLLQGPIERSGDLLPQLKQPYKFDYDNLRTGLLQFSWGLLKKLVIADQLALMVNPVYDNVYAYTGLPLLLATYYFALQIYFDFSGYSDMALGAARVFNIKLTQNFNNPYFSRSIADFWRRWHISFSRWILDYIFKPVQMSLRAWKTWGIVSALVVTFFVSGLWHGASWTFIVWGLLHGFYMSCAVIYKPIQKKLHGHFNIRNNNPLLRIWQIFFTFHLACFAWIFFRANNIHDAIYVVKNLLHAFNGHTLLNIKSNIYVGNSLFTFIVIMLYSLVVIASDNIYNHKVAEVTLTKRRYISWPIIYLIIFSSIVLGNFDNYSFIYNRF